MLTTLVRTMAFEVEMLDHAILAAVAEQMMREQETTVEGRGPEGVRFADWGAAAADGAVCDGWEGVSGD